ncbi:MAG TPA: DNA-binding response regulator [Actinobacteria bacterium]|nr:DNA-binding response regulator [Actinomycetota bacterium]
MRLLLVEDQKKLVTYLKKGLENNSFAVDFSYDGKKGLELALYGDYDLIILDIMLPEMDGIQVCKSLRAKKIDTPVLMLTAKDAIADKVEGLYTGADDYLTKPFSFDELLARIAALLRRPHKKEPEILTSQDISLDNLKHIVKKGQNKLDFTLKEYSVLEYLLRNKGQVLSREQINDHCWDFNNNSFTNNVDVYIKRIRKKLDEKYLEKYIQTVYGVGYKFKE